MMGAVSSSNAEPRQLPRIHVWIDTSAEVDPIDVLMSDASSVIASLEDPLPRLLFNLEELLWFIVGMELYRV